jgi:DNA-binding IscR family transcriptional regulator
MTTRLSVDRYVVDTLMRDLVRHDRSPSAYLVYLHLASQARGRAPLYRSLAEIAHATGVSKRAVQNAVRLLKKRELIASTHQGRTAIPGYTVRRPWVRRRKPAAP